MKLYARPDGSHVHIDRGCLILAGGDFERLGYKEVTIGEARTRRLNVCPCTSKMLGTLMPLSLTYLAERMTG